MDSPKYNRTFHIPWSPGGTSDDKRAASVDSLIDVPVVITEKMDGSNTSLEADGCFSRTHSGAPTHVSFDGLKALHATVKYKIPERLQLFGEWCFAKHSIQYQELPGYFLLFNIRDIDEKRMARYGEPMWFGWDEVELWAEEIGVPTVPVLYKGMVKSEKELKELTESLMIQPSLCGGIREGVVVRIASGFADDEFSTSVMKCVRANHVQTTEHWKDQEIIRNKLK
jgi:hypothetical protein